MRKFAILLAALIAASLTMSSAEAAGKKKAAGAKAETAGLNDGTRKLFHDAFHGSAPKADAKKGGKKGKRA